MADFPAPRLADGLDFAPCRDVLLPDGRLSPPPAHVKIGVRAIVANPWFLLADEMGGMKTAQAIIAAQFLRMSATIDRVVVVAPASVRPVWTDPEIGELAKHLFLPSRIIDLHSTMKNWDLWPLDHNPPPKVGLWVTRMQWIVTNYEWIRSGNYASVLPFCDKRTLLVLDESALVKNWKSQQTKACRELRARCGRALLLNGTPVAHDPEDLFSQANLMHESVLDCKYVTRFRMRYASLKPVVGLGGKKLKDRRGHDIETVAEWTNLPDLQRRLAPFTLRRLTKECVDLPGVLPPTTTFVALTPPTWRIYREVRDKLVAFLEDGGTAAVKTAAIKVMRLAQITSGLLGGVDLEEDGGDFLDFGADEPADLSLLESVQWDGDGLITSPGDLESLKYAALLEEPVEPVARKVLSTEFVGREKLDATLDRLDELWEGDPLLKILVWCRFAPELRRLMAEAAVRWSGLELGAIAGSPALGHTVKAERAAAIRLLNPQTAAKGRALVGGIYGAGSLGLNLTACHVVIFMSYDYSDFKYKQTLARVDRPGQTEVVRTTDVVATGPKGQKTIDHKIAAMRRAQGDLAELTMSAWTARDWVKALTEE